MKKALFAVAGLLSVAPVVAQAQSSVTLYGLVDAGIGYVNNIKGGSAFQLTSGRLSGSRFHRDAGEKQGRCH